MELAKETTRSHAPIVLFAVILSAPLLAFPDTGFWYGMRPVLIQAVAFGSMALMLARLRWSVEGLRSFLTTGPNLAVLLFLGWTSLSFAFMAPVEGRGRAIALAELMRLASGAAIYFAVVYRCSSRDHLKLAALLLLVGGALASAAGMLSAGISESNGATGAYGNKQLLAAFLVLLLPVAIVFAQTGEKFIRPLFSTTAALRCLLATLATLMLVASLLLTNNRSSWLGSVVGLLVITALLLCTRKRQEERKHHWIASPVVAFACLILLLVLLGTESGVIERAKTLTAPTQVGSFQQRLQLWSICEQMIRERPLMGFGVGSFPMKAGDYSEALATRKDEQTVAASGGDTIGVPSSAQVEKEGASLSSLPHNEYLQLAAEQGLIGLALYLAVLVRFFYRGIRVLPHLAKISRTRKLMLIAAMGAIAAQCVDAIGNPGWHFGDVSPVFWLMLGIGIAATRTADQQEMVDAEDRVPAPRSLRYRLWPLGWQSTSAVLTLALIILFFVGTVSARSGWLIALYNPGGGCPTPPVCSSGTHFDPVTCKCVSDTNGSQCSIKVTSADPNPGCICEVVTFTATVSNQQPGDQIKWSGGDDPATGSGSTTYKTRFTNFPPSGQRTVTAICGNSSNSTTVTVKSEQFGKGIFSGTLHPTLVYPENLGGVSFSASSRIAFVASVKSYAENLFSKYGINVNFRTLQVSATFKEVKGWDLWPGVLGGYYLTWIYDFDNIANADEATHDVTFLRSYFQIPIPVLLVDRFPGYAGHTTPGIGAVVNPGYSGINYDPTKTARSVVHELLTHYHGWHFHRTLLGNGSTPEDEYDYEDDRLITVAGPDAVLNEKISCAVAERIKKEGGGSQDEKYILRR